MDRLALQFRQHCTRARLLPPRGRILVALSGGADSMTLLHLVRSAFPEATVAAAHFDHAWRADSGADAAWVADACRAVGIDCLVERAEGPPANEAAARAARYGFLGRAAYLWRADRVATAHHADDQAETILFRIARGAGTRGLAGIPARRGHIVRPLLPFRRAALTAYARTHGVAWRDDHSNRDLKFARNRIRHVLIPALDAHTPGMTEQLLEIGRLAGEAETCWRRELRSVLEAAVIAQDEARFTLASDVLLGYHPTVHARVLRTLAARLGVSLCRSGTRQGVAFVGQSRSGTGVDLGAGVHLSRAFDKLILGVRAESGEADVPVSIPSLVAGSGEAVIGGRRVRVRWDMDAAERGSAVAFDPAQLRFPLELRGWRPGDHIRLECGSKKLKKLFVERRVERSSRGGVPVLAESGAGRVLWLPGIARAAGGDPVSGSPVFSIRLEA